jgi:hypothetical protein
LEATCRDWARVTGGVAALETQFDLEAATPFAFV